MPTNSNGKLRIDQLAATYGIEPRDIEHFEKIGLLRPSRDEFGSFYSTGDEVRLLVILKAQKLGFDESLISAILAVARWGGEGQYE